MNNRMVFSKRWKFLIGIITICISFLNVSYADDGHRLWLRYDRIQNHQLRNRYIRLLQQVTVFGSSKTIGVTKKELRRGLDGLLGQHIPFGKGFSVKKSSLIVGTPKSSPLIDRLNIQKKLNTTGKEGYIILTKKIDGRLCLIIAANEDIGLLYGSFRLLRMLQTHHSLRNLHIKSVPKTKLRLLNHWDNLDGSVERGYAGKSIWRWKTLPNYIRPRYRNYARANASIGINGVVLNNVNADARILEHDYLKKVAALANIFRPYGIKVYLSAKFSAPVDLGGLSSADPLSTEVKKWWQDKTDDIYALIPNFGGFLVKANSEGQPGPQDYGRSHAQGANMLARALAPHNGVVMWRAFVHSPQGDRAKQQYDEFEPLDGTFADNVILQVKNGPIDFQPREPFNPLFGAMPDTPLMMEFQITQEYLGWATSLVYLGPLFKSTLQADTYRDGEGTTVAKIIEGNVNGKKLTGMAGVANIGRDRNWTGHPFVQANWYAFGRLAWNPDLSASDIADNWLRMTFSNNESFINPVKKMMMRSWDIAVNYRTPLGLYLLTDHRHFGPAPWQRRYIHQADSSGIGINRTIDGSNAVRQYASVLATRFDDPKKTPEKFLLWFHRLAWSYELKSGRSLWQSLVHHYYSGVDSVRWMQKTWESARIHVDPKRFKLVESLLKTQEKQAVDWRNACVLYFQKFADQPIPDGYGKPAYDLSHYKK